MKKITAVLLTGAMLCSLAACSPQNSEKEAAPSSAGTTAAATAATTGTLIQPTATAAALSAELMETLKAHSFEGVVYAAKNGVPIASYADGTLENGAKITIDSPMPVGSVSKQFCAAAVLLLQEQGKLSVNDTLDRYYPEYTQGSKIKLHHLLSMRSGIPEPTADNGIEITDENTEQENLAAIKQWVFSQKLQSQPDESFTYTNINYVLLSDIVSQVSGKRYIDFIRESFFTPLGMTHTGAVIELPQNPDWAQGLVYQQLDTQPGVTNGCGDIIANAADITMWINALASGRVISEESFHVMITDYSPEEHYGYGIYTDLKGGVGHYGAIGIYSAFDYIDAAKGFTLVVCSNSIEPVTMDGLAEDLLTDLAQ